MGEITFVFLKITGFGWDTEIRKRGLPEKGACTSPVAWVLKRSSGEERQKNRVLKRSLRYRCTILYSDAPNHVSRRINNVVSTGNRRL